jgi:hypothetical protein
VSVRPLGLYALAFGLMLAAGAALAVAAGGFLENTQLLWISVGLSIGAIVVAVLTVVLRPNDR